MKDHIEKTNLPIYYFHQGTNYRAYEFMGAHFSKEKDGVVFRTWAPNASSVSVVGDFNDWNTTAHVMNKVSDGGVYELFIKGVKQFDAYKFYIKNNDRSFFKADPYAFHSETLGKTASKVYDIEAYKWNDKNFISSRSAPYDKPMNIYELNLASWKRKEDGSYYTYRDYAEELVPYVKEMGYTHVELMPISEYPFDGSWGYQVTGYYSPSARFGEPKDFMYFVDVCHRNGISVIVDWVPAHFPKDEHGLYEFDGECCYENKGWDRKENKGWGTRLFDLGRNEVQCFLVSNALFLFDKYHVDGLRVDAVAAMLYLDYDKKDGEWIPNENGGNYNLQAIEFFKKLNGTVFLNYPNVLMIAEESTSFPMITKPTDVGGLGFNYKWNMGWMNDILSYVEGDPYFRAAKHDKITFSMFYAFSENFILPISHDEVVHGKKSILDKMPGDVFTKFSNLRAFNCYMYAHPGKKLTFMGSEFGQFKEWDYKEGIEFFMLKFDLHRKLLNFNKELNHLYKSTPALYEIEDGWNGFNWISADERDNNVVSFERKDKNGRVLCAIINFSGNNYSNYRLGVEKGEYKIVLNSDDKKFGGCGFTKGKTFKSVRIGAHGRKNSIRFNLPRFSGIYFLKF